MSVRAADDFEAIRARIEDLRAPLLPDQVSPHSCPGHEFDAMTQRCQHCNLHFYHLPALEIFER